MIHMNKITKLRLVTAQKTRRVTTLLELALRGGSLFSCFPFVLEERLRGADKRAFTWAMPRWLSLSAFTRRVYGEDGTNLGNLSNSPRGGLRSFTELFRDRRVLCEMVLAAE